MSSTAPINSSEPTQRDMTREELLALPAVVDLTTAAGVLGIGRTCAYELVRTGEWPTPVLRLGRLIRIPTTPLLDLLGVEPVARKTG
jgi:predicted DNA-binding transcriptional regulator AlpA